MTTNQQQQQMQANRWQFRLPCGCSGAMWGASPDRAHPGLHLDPLDAAMGECSHRIAAAAAFVNNFGRKHKTLTKNHF